jgi:uncharacterized RDD family membrane protein YckC
MKRNYLLGFLSAIATLTLILAPITRGENSPPPAPAATDKPAPPPAAEPAKPETPPAPVAAEAPAAPSAATVTPESQADESAKEAETAEPPAKELRRLDTEAEPTAGDVHRQVRNAIKEAMHKHAASPRTGNEKVSIGHDTHVGKDEKADAAVSILGSTTVDGEVSDAAVSVLGSTTINGSVGDAAVSVLGSTTVNGHAGEVVAVGGNIELGPNADVSGDVVVVGGSLQKDPGAVVHGQVQQVSIAQHFPKFDWLFAWVKSALFKGRLLSFASGTGWAWMVAGAFLGFYLLCALIFPRGIEKCAETLEQQPGFTILTALLTMLAMPLVITLLAITGIGILVIPFLVTGLFAAKLFGRATMLAWFGRRFTGWLGGGLFSHAVMNVLIGGILVALLYTVPILAFIVSMLIGVLGLGAVIYALILSMRRSAGQQSAKPAPAAVAGTPMAGPPPPVAGMAFATGGAGESAAGVVPPVVPVAAPPAVVSAATLPRAGFWIRTGALAIDLILCVLIIEVIPWVHFRCSLCLLVLAVYGAVMWKLRGTTVGGSICHLKVVRLDDRPLDWTVVVVRALSCFLSLFVVGLGFLWVAFDDEKQSWHDKIAGTAVVQMPKGVALI